MTGGRTRVVSPDCAYVPDVTNGRSRTAWAAWPGYVFIVGGVIYLAMGEAAGLIGVGVGVLIVLAWWLASRRTGS